MKVTFYIGKHHKDFRKKIKEEIYAMDLLKIRYVIFIRSTTLLPVMDIDGYRVAGLDVIKEVLLDRLGWYYKHRIDDVEV